VRTETGPLTDERAPARKEEAREPAAPAPVCGVPAELTPGVVMRLQASAGNQAVARLLASAASPAGLTSAPGERHSRAQGNAAVERMLLRDQPPEAAPADVRKQDPVQDLRLGLQRRGKAPLLSLLDGQQLTLSPPFALPRLVPLIATPDAVPTQIAFGPLSSDAALKAATQLPQKPDWWERALLPRDRQESAVDVYIIYENDGSGPAPNFGAGSDQGRTAALYIYALFNKHGTGLSRLGVTPMEMITPRGTLPEGAPKDQTSTYQTAAGPYSGVASIDVGVTVSRTGSSSVEILGSVGVDSREWGELVQGIIHRKVSDSPIFPWPSGTKPLVEGGVRWNKSINDLTRDSFAGLKYTGRLELGAGALTGTRRTEAGADARFVIRTGEVQTPAGAISFEISPLGVFARGFVRYNDGRAAPIGGVEGGATASFMVNMGRVGLGLQGQTTVSTDPAFQTGQAAGDHAAGLGQSPVVGKDQAGNPYGPPAGAHGTGQVILKFAF
jgi:hypothetical protein